MKVEIIPSDAREINITATKTELVELYLATRQGRRTKAQSEILELFGEMIVNADITIEAAANQKLADTGSDAV
jgi:hypothetical protein